MKMIYIAGKVTGLDANECAQKFDNAEHELYDSGFTAVVNPVKYIGKNNWQNESWEFIMKQCIKALAECDAIYCLPCWANSRGATLERYVAGALGLKIIEAGTRKQ